MIAEVTDIGSQVHIGTDSRRKFIEAVEKEGWVEKFEAPNLRKDRSIIWTSSSARRVHDLDGNLLYFEGFVEDITARKQMELDLRVAEARYREMVEQIPASVYTDAVDEDSTNLYSSPQVLLITGYSPSEWLEDPHLRSKLIHPDDRERVMRLHAQANAGKLEFNCEYRIVTKSGRVAWIRDTAKMVRAANDEPLYWQGVMLDITEQKKADEAIRQSEDRFSKVFQSSPIATCITTWEDGRFVDANLAYWSLSGYAPEELRGRTVIEMKFIDADRRTELLKSIQLQKPAAGAQDKFFTKSGEVRDVLTFYEIIRLNDQDCILSMFHDITEQKRMQDDLAGSEKRFRSLIEHSMDVIALASADATILFQSPAASELLGYSVEEMTGKNALEFVHPGDRLKAMRAMKRTLVRPEEHTTVEIRALHKDGSARWLELIATNRLREPGVEAIVANYRDITERKRGDQFLREAEARYRALVENIPAVIYMDRAADETTIYMNPGIEALTGYTAEEWIADNELWEKSLHPEDRAKIMEQDRAANEGGGPFNAEYRMLTRDGRTIWVRELASLIRDGEGKGLFWQGVIIDVTAEKRAQEGLRRREAILGAIAYAADQFLKSEKWKNNINAILGRLGAVSETSRVYIVRRDAEAVNLAQVTRMYEWCAPGVAPQVRSTASPMADMKKLGLQRWIQRFQQGEPLFGIVRELPQQEQEQLVQDQVRSLLCLPIMIGNAWWGFMGFEDCTSEREWSPSEIEALRAAANILSAAIQREQATESVQRQVRELTMLHAVALASSSAASTDELIQRVTSILGDTLVPDTYGILLVTQNGNALKPHESYVGTDRKNIDLTLDMGSGVTGMVALTKAPIRLGNVAVAPEYVEVTPGIKSELSVPIMSAERLIGVINLESRKEEAFTQNDERLINTIAGGIGTAIEKLRLYEAQRRRARESDSLREATSALTKSLDLPTLLELTLDLLPDFAPFDSASLMLKDADGEMYIAAKRGMPDKFIGDKLQPAGNWSELGANHEPLILGDALRDTRIQKIPGIEYIRSWMGVPLVANEQVIGLLNLHSHSPDTYTHEHATLVQTFANQAASVIQNARLFSAEQQQHLREAAILDLMRVAAASLDLDVVIENILWHLIRLIPADSGTIQLLEGETLYVSAAIGFIKDAIRSGHALRLEDYPLNRQVVSERRAVRIGNVHEDPRYRWIAGADSVISILAVPILFKGEVIGMMTLDSPRLDRFTVEDEQLALAVANNAAIAIGNARLFESEQQRRQEAENLRVAASAITSSLDSKQVLETILVALKQVVPYDSASMLLLDDDVVRITAAKGLPVPGLALNQVFPATNKLLTAIQESGQPLILPDARNDARFENWAAADRVRGWMGVPLTIRGQICGFITLDSYSANSFDERSASLAQTFAHQAAAAIDNARLYEETRTRLEEMEIVSRISFGLRAAQDAEEMMPVLLSELLNIMKTDSGSIWLFDESSGRLVRKIAAGWNQNLPIAGFKPGEGIVGHVFERGEPRLVPDFGNDPDSQPENRKYFQPDWGGIVLPIRTTTDIIGVIVVAVPSSRRIAPHEVQLITTVAEIAGNAMHRLNLYVRSEEQVRRLVALRDVDMAIAGSFDLQVTLNILLDHLLAQLQVDAAAIQTFNADMQILTPLAGLGFYRHASSQGTLRISEGPAGRLLSDREDIHIADLNQEAGFRRKDQLAGEGFVGYYATPLVSKGQTKGILETFFRQPFAPSQHWLDFLHAMAGQAAIAIDNAQLFENLQRSNQELSLAYDTTLEGWGKALELRDKETQGHTFRVTDMTLRLARRVGIPESELPHVRRGVLLHDIGKMGVPDHILKKTGELSADEWAEMRRHPKYAYDLLYPIAYLREVLDIPYCHHERWDGTGYPRSLQGEAIPLAARVFSVVDVWDALLYDRPYRKAWERHKVLRYISDQAGTRFDPAVAKEFLLMIAEDK
ncbi:MAG TPA: GAF domain-containing protein [Anaerolineales bacterium]